MKRKGVRLKMWEYFCVFAVLLLLVIWLLQIAFLQYYYIGAMAKETLNNAREIVQMYKNKELDEKEVRKSARENNLSIVITDKDGNIISASDAMGEMDQNRVNDLNQYGGKIGDVKERIAASSNKEVYYNLEHRYSEGTILFYAAYTDEGVEEGGSYIYVVSVLEPINSVITVLQGQFGIITIIALFFALFFSYLIVQRFSKPMEDLTKKARQLALGNNNVNFNSNDAVAEITELSEAFDYAAKELTKSTKLRQELMANVSHDLRTPLTMIKMYAEMIRDLTGDDKQKREKNLKVIIDETDRLTLLVNDILDLSKIEASENNLDICEFDICNLIKNIIDRFEVVAQQENIQITSSMPQNLSVLGDFKRIQQVVYNLLGNAVNYSSGKNVLVRVSVESGEAKVEIIDSGKGIPESELPNVWDRYYRAQTHVRTKVGTGLGLSIVKSILVAHEVDFGIESHLGVGSNFWFKLKIPKNSINKTLLLTDNNSVK